MDEIPFWLALARLPLPGATWEARTSIEEMSPSGCVGLFVINDWCVRAQLTVDSATLGQVSWVK